jgi:hypothetical protein
MKDSDFHLNFFKYPKKKNLPSIVVVTQPQQVQRTIRRSPSNLDRHNLRAAQLLAKKDAKLKRIRLASIKYAQLRKEHSSYDATQILGHLLKDVFLAHEISKVFEEALLKEFEKNGSAIQLKK